MLCSQFLGHPAFRRQDMQTVCSSSMHTAGQLTSSHSPQHPPQRTTQHPPLQTISAPSERAPPPPLHKDTPTDHDTPHRLKSAPEDFRRARREQLQTSCPLPRPQRPLHAAIQAPPSSGDLSETAPVFSQHAEETPVKYGELIIVGYNGTLPQGNKGRIRSKFALQRRSVASGVKPVKNHVITGSPQQCELIQDHKQHSVSFTLSRSQAVVVQYDHDKSLDMFQIGRSSELPIDYVIMDTARGNKENMTSPSEKLQSTISRFACRILVEREPPYTARIYAAGFDSGRNIFLGEKATKWYAGGEIDGLTTNGVLISKPKPAQDNCSAFSTSNIAGVWREISVGGGVYAFRDGRSTPQKNSLVAEEDNILIDGTLIDLCGATLIWRTTTGLDISPSRTDLDSRIDELNAGRPQCPVGLTTLVLPNRTPRHPHHHQSNKRRPPGGKNYDLDTCTDCGGGADDGDEGAVVAAPPSADRQPHVYIGCGHVHGRHCWRQADDCKANRTCPICLSTSTFTKLHMGIETSFYIDNEQPTYCFSPCGHMASENTVKYWSSIGIPQGCSGFKSICPFCSTPLSSSSSWVRLIFQDNID